MQVHILRIGSIHLLLNYFTLNHNCQYFNHYAKNKEANTKSLSNIDISHQKSLCPYSIVIKANHQSLNQIVSHQVKSKFVIIVISIAQNISQSSSQSSKSLSCQKSKHFSSISINQIYSNSFITNFNGYIIMTYLYAYLGHLQTRFQSTYSYYCKNLNFLAHITFCCLLHVCRNEILQANI